MRFTTFCSGHNDKSEFVQFRITGKAKPETVKARAEKRGIISTLRAEAVSFDGSGKGRHVRQLIVAA